MGRNPVESGLIFFSAVAVVTALHVTDGIRSVDPIKQNPVAATSRTAVLPQREKLIFASGPQTKVK